MTESEPRREVVPNPESVLVEVGLTPESLRGKRVIAFGGSLEGSVSGAEITDFTDDHYEAYIAGDGELPITGERDYIVVTNEPRLQSPLGREQREDYLAAVIGLLNPDGGILRIAKPTDDYTPDIAASHQYLLNEQMGLPVHVRYDTTDAENPYLSIETIAPIPSPALDERH
jgi:hypothetical protein